MPTLALNFAGELWHRIPDEDPYASRFYDGHYSRQTPGARGILAPGRRVLLWHEGPRGPALWGVVLNLDPVGAMRWRNSVFRNKSGTQSSALIAHALLATWLFWIRTYERLPILNLTTEIDIEATRVRRSKRHDPGHCYLEAGWRKVRDIEAGHGRSAKVELAAPHWFYVALVARSYQ
jgi:hypothetical protein